ncbi:hypothetical protein BDP27DRAFT_170050 [Rhodocollybia butyracea]|uniref:BTB domain-containing protein n=1 Tax=Rhodocollybia butyracea TaxID=206335 RepID=A0A9P5U3A5_9AGAR|nr:hypothetical protein BDP27DRAFT_170050 [Rhodocollybia butyracea]
MDSLFVGKPLPPPRATTMKELNDRRFKEFAALKLKEEPIDEPADNLYVRFAPPPPPKTSSRFNAQDAEITVLSSDNVLFRLHKANARVTSGGLLPSQSSGTEDAFLTLPEPAEILEILFEFLYPDYETDLERLEFSALLRVAEAAEKYVVFYAMNHCTFCLRCASSSSPCSFPQ